jgi:multidrug resistance efflux pump
MLVIITAGILLAAVSILRSSFQSDDGSGGFRGGARERVFAVEYDVVKPATVTPVIETFGEIVSGRTLELRAASGGALVHLSDNFREGGTVTSGEVLFQTEPSAANADLRLNQSLLSEAVSEQAEAIAALDLAQDELAAARRQLELRNDALVRQEKLRERGVGTEASLEAASLAVSAAEQSVLSKRQLVANADARINRASTSIERAEINRDEAARRLKDTQVIAAFDGALADVTAVAGGLVTANERLGRLIDPSALEVSVRLSSDEFLRMSDANGNLRAAKVTVQFSAMEADVHGKIDRVSAAVGEGQTGRAIFASLMPQDAKFLRVGDFVTVQIIEPSLQNVMVVPNTAVSSSGDVLLVGAEDRITSAKVTILRQQGSTVIIDPIELVGKRLILKRAPQLGDGIRVRASERAGNGETKSAPIPAKETVKLKYETVVKLFQDFIDQRRLRDLEPITPTIQAINDLYDQGYWIQI